MFLHPVLRNVQSTLGGERTTPAQLTAAFGMCRGTNSFVWATAGVLSRNPHNLGVYIPRSMSIPIMLWNIPFPRYQRGTSQYDYSDYFNMGQCLFYNKCNFSVNAFNNRSFDHISTGAFPRQINPGLTSHTHKKQTNKQT